MKTCMRWAYLLSISLAVLGGVLTHCFYPRQYQAWYLLEENDDLLIRSIERQRSVDLATAERPIVFRAEVLDRVLRDEAMRGGTRWVNLETARAELMKRLSVESAGVATRMAVGYIGEDPMAASRICNAVVKSYLRQKQHQAEQQSLEIKQVFDSEIKRSWQEVESQRKRVEAAAKLLQGYRDLQPSPILLAKREQLHALTERIIEYRIPLTLDDLIQRIERDGKLPANFNGPSRLSPDQRRDLERRVDELHDEYGAVLSQLQDMEAGNRVLIESMAALNLNLQFHRLLKDGCDSIVAEAKSSKPIRPVAHAMPPLHRVSSWRIPMTVSVATVGALLPLFVGRVFCCRSQPMADQLRRSGGKGDGQ